LIQSASLTVTELPQAFAREETLSLTLRFSVTDLCVFDPVLRIFIRRRGETAHLLSADTHQGGLFFPWLPRGDYSFNYSHRLPFPEGDYELGIAWGSPREIRDPDVLHPLRISAGTAVVSAENPSNWTMSEETRSRIEKLSWQAGMKNWFHRHFCHAAGVIGETFLAHTPLLKGRILDIGGGDGVTDLSLLLRYRPQELVVMDIVDYIAELPRVATENGLPLERLPDNFVFVRQSCESVPYPDASFDVVLSWGSVEHIVGGYKKALDEVWRVLKPGGLFFVNPGLYYSSYGSHLGEFSDEPHLHLKIPEEELRALVMSGRPRLMDRAGFDVSNTEYWRFYKELNRIKVAEFEAELKVYGYTVVRAALRVNDVVEYSPELQQYSVLDLAVEDAFFTLQKPAGLD
jgi:ubiquinone/menaquinone biosynthesis C-methylase UbiE